MLAGVSCVELETGAIARYERSCAEWLRRLIGAEPSLLEARNKAGYTPLLAAAQVGSNAGTATLLELGADASSAAIGESALGVACFATSLPVVRQLIAAGAASASALPPGTAQSQMVAYAALMDALSAERGCGQCAFRCRGGAGGNCADGLDILRAVLAAGVRERVDPEGNSLALRVVLRMTAPDAADRVSAEHALMILQALHAAGVDVLARGPADELPILHAAIAADAPAVVRWLLAVAGAPLEERDSDRDYTPLMIACQAGAWAAAHALLDCGARVDVQSTAASRAWPVTLAAAGSDLGCALLRRLLAADRDSLLRRAAAGLSALHMAAMINTDSLKVLLGSGLPHLAEAVNAVAVVGASTHEASAGSFVTPLDGACSVANWDAALALLAAGARVDMTGLVHGASQTIAEWARGSPACKHRGVKRAIAARAREHAAQAAAAAKSLPFAGSGTGAVAIEAGASEVASVRSGDPPSYASSTPVASTHPASGAKMPAKARKELRRAAKNRAEVCEEDGSAASTTSHQAAAVAAVAPDAAAQHAAGEVPAVAAIAAGAACCNSPETVAPALSAANLSEDPTLAHTQAATVLLSLPVDTSAGGTSVPCALNPCERVFGACASVAAAGTLPEGPSETPAPPAARLPPGPGPSSPSWAGPAASSTNVCEPGDAAAPCTNVCEQGEGEPAAKEG